MFKKCLKSAQKMLGMCCKGDTQTHFKTPKKNGTKKQNEHTHTHTHKWIAISHIKPV